MTEEPEHGQSCQNSAVRSSPGRPHRGRFADGATVDTVAALIQEAEAMRVRLVMLPSRRCRGYANGSRKCTRPRRSDRRRAAFKQARAERDGLAAARVYPPLAAQLADLLGACAPATIASST